MSMIYTFIHIASFGHNQSKIFNNISYLIGITLFSYAGCVIG